MSVQSRRTFQYSLKWFLAFVCMAALLAWVIHWLNDESPTDQFLAYEKAKAYHGMTATIGPNQIRIESIVRNQRSGPLLKAPLSIDGIPDVDSNRPVALESELENAGPWLDVVQIELMPGSDLLDILELRVFDHATREELQVGHPACGYRVVPPNLLHVYGLGTEIPKAIDVWLRVHSYDVMDTVQQLPPRLYAATDVGGFEVTVVEAQTGYIGWTSKDGLMPVTGESHSDCALVLDWDGPESDTSYQIAAYNKDGEKFFHDRLVNPHFHGVSKSVVHFPVPLDQIDHLEIRPHGGRHRFFFDGVQVPELAPQPRFSKPPTAVLAVGGVPVKSELVEFLPLDVT
ncbi:MAG: hypothetical protein ACR2NZ_15155, partial [Rubripirellula sp.]